jgi:hypothetical protein
MADAAHHFYLRAPDSERLAEHVNDGNRAAL